MLSAIYLTGEAEKDKYTINVRGLILINKGNVLYLKLLFLGLNPGPSTVLKNL